MFVYYTKCFTNIMPHYPYNNPVMLVLLSFYKGNKLLTQKRQQIAIQVSKTIL